MTDRILRTVRLEIPAAALDDGTAVSPAVVAARLRVLAGIVRPGAEARIAAAWESRTVGLIASATASHAHTAVLEVYGLAAWPPPGIYASDRVRRMADESAGRVLRSTVRRMAAVTAVLPVWMPQAAFLALDKDGRAAQSARLAAAWPDGMAPVERRGILRQIAKSPGVSEPYDILRMPSFSDATHVPLDAADRQQVRLRDGRLSVLLPTADLPGRGDWAWHTLPLAVPAWASARYGDDLCAPAVHVSPRGVRLLLPLEVQPPPAVAGERVLGLDWGVRRLLTGAIAYPDGAAAITTGRPFFFSASVLLAKNDRRRALGESLNAASRQIGKLLAGHPDAALEARLAVIDAERAHVWRRVGCANDQFAHAAARWVIETALAEGCAVIALEDLATLEAGGLGKRTNAGVSQSVRGMIADRIIEKAQVAGLRVVLVPARGTSSLCSRCGRPSAFRHAPDRRGGHDNWLVCACRRSSDRDHASGEAIAARGIDAALLPAKPSRKKRPVAGPASRRPIRVVREPRRRCQRLALAPVHTPPCPRGAAAPRRVGRGPAVAARGRQAGQLLQQTPAPIEARSRVLDGLCGGYGRSVRFTRVRALAPPRPDGAGTRRK
jgi:hypothetical protein